MVFHLHMTHIKLQISFYMKRKRHTELHARDNCAREVSNRYVIRRNCHMSLTYIVIFHLFCFWNTFVLTYITQFAQLMLHMKQKHSALGPPFKNDWGRQVSELYDHKLLIHRSLSLIVKFFVDWYVTVSDRLQQKKCDGKKWEA